MSWESLWIVAGGSMLALLALFLMVGGGFFLALVVLALLPVVLAALATRRPATEGAAMASPAAVTSVTLQGLPSGPFRAGVSEPGIPAALFGLVLVAGVAVAAVHASLGLYHLTAIALLAVMAGTVMVLGETVPAVARRIRSELALVNRVAAPGGGMAVQVVASKGECAWGYDDRNRWTITADGLVTPRLCQAVATSLTSAFRGSAGERCGECTVQCRCPLAGRELTFAARPMPVAA